MVNINLLIFIFMPKYLSCFCVLSLLITTLYAVSEIRGVVCELFLLSIFAIK